MKIVFLNKYQDEVERGAESFVKELSQHLLPKHQVDIFSGKRADSLAEVLKGNYDVVIPVNGRIQAIKVSLGRLIGGYKVLITGHSGRGWDDIWNIAISRPDVFVALTDVMANWARNWAWGSKVVKIPNGIDLAKFSPEGEKIKFKLPKPIILSVGALVWYKHHDRVINAVSNSKVGSVVIIGEGPLRRQLENLAREKLGKRFLISNFKNEQMPKVYRSVDLFTLPSWDREAFGIVYLEAMASGLPVVAPDDLSRREIIGEGGLFVDVSDCMKYSAAIKQVPSLNLSKKARKQAEKFSWDKVAEKYEQLMLNMVKKK